MLIICHFQILLAISELQLTLPKVLQYILSSQTEKLMAGTKFSDYLGLNHYKKAKKLKHFIHLRLAQGLQSFVTYRSILPVGNSSYQRKNHVLVM